MKNLTLQWFLEPSHGFLLLSSSLIFIYLSKARKHLLYLVYRYSHKSVNTRNFSHKTAVKSQLCDDKSHIF